MPELDTLMELGGGDGDDLESAILDLEDMKIWIVSEVSPGVSFGRAREYLNHGVARRLSYLHYCASCVDSVLPKDRESRFSASEQKYLTMNLHVHWINLAGILDNLAWFTLFRATEREVEVKRRKSIYLSSRKVREHLSSAARAVLDEEVTTRWIAGMRNFRDALAHRIPPYVPPSLVLTEDVDAFRQVSEQIDQAILDGRFDDVSRLEAEQDQLTQMAPFVLHSYGDPDAASPVPVRSSLAADLRQVMRIVRVVCGS